MVARKKPTKLVKIGLSHSERARELASRGMYNEALSELKIALFSLRNENSDGLLNLDIATVLNSIGNVNLLLLKYDEAAEAFKDSLAIKKPMTNNPDIAASLIGLSDAYRGLCSFDEAIRCLDDALNVALSRKNDALASRVINLMDMLERTRENLPSRAYDGKNERYAPGSLDGVHAVLRHIDVDISPEKVRMRLIIGFPGLTDEILFKANTEVPLTCAGIFFNGRSAEVTGMQIIDEAEEPVKAVVERFEGVLFAPGSYNRHSPLPVPSCKKFVYTGGQGSLLKWDLSPDGWYSAEVEMSIPGVEYGFRFLLALPFYVKLSKITVDVKKPLEYGLLRIDEGTFHATHIPERVTITTGPAYSLKRRLFEGSVFGRLELETESSLKFAAIAFELSKRG